MASDAPDRISLSHPTERVDVVIVGAGISGIGSACMLRERFPDLSFVILDAMEAPGGTWLLHKYPGTRSDSDLFTFGYGFKPWRGDPIATRQQILDYLESVIADADLSPRIRYRHRVRSASWSSERSAWRLELSVGDEPEPRRIEAGFLWMCQGYYRHEAGYVPTWPGLEAFRGEVIHPQRWPDSADLRGKRVVVIGSGATAATLIPALADECEHVTMLQRTPTFFATGRNADTLADELRRLGIDETWIHEIMRRKVVRDRADLIERARTDPEGLKRQLTAGVRACLPEGYDVERHFTPPYKPLQQRVAFVPDGDLFRAIGSGKASVVTDHIESVDALGIRLRSGDRINCDVIVTATGFDLAVMGDIPFFVDGRKVDFAQTVGYRGILFTGVPNMAWVYGYARYSWTLRVELVGTFVCNLLAAMRARNARSVTASIPSEDAGMALHPWVDPEDMNSGYMLRGLDRLPRRGSKPEWQHSQDYLEESEVLPRIDFADPIFSFAP